MAESKDYGSASTPPSGDDDSARMLAEMHKLQEEVQKLQEGMTAVLGINGLTEAVTHGFQENAKVLEGFKGAFTRPQIVLTADEKVTLDGLFATFVRPVTDDIEGPIPSAVDPAPATPTMTQFPDRSGATTQKGSAS